jgi:hypothetical protein
MSSFLAGVLYLRGLITYDDLARYFSFLQYTHDLGPKAIVYGERVQGANAGMPKMRGDAYHRLVKSLGRQRLDVLHELMNDRLICPVDELREILVKVPLTTITFLV